MRKTLKIGLKCGCDLL